MKDFIQNAVFLGGNIEKNAMKMTFFISFFTFYIVF